MSDELKALIEKARRVEMSREQREAQRRSFAYGNSKFENDRISRETVNREAESLATRDAAQK